jgi:hypothetical protein
MVDVVRPGAARVSGRSPRRRTPPACLQAAGRGALQVARFGAGSAPSPTRWRHAPPAPGPSSSRVCEAGAIAATKQPPATAWPAEQGLGVPRRGHHHVRIVPVRPAASVIHGHAAQRLQFARRVRRARTGPRRDLLEVVSASGELEQRARCLHAPPKIASRRHPRLARWRARVSPSRPRCAAALIALAPSWRAATVAVEKSWNHEVELPAISVRRPSRPRGPGRAARRPIVESWTPPASCDALPAM